MQMFLDKNHFNPDCLNIYIEPGKNHRLFYLMLYHVHFPMNGVRTLNISGDRHRLHR